MVSNSQVHESLMRTSQIMTATASASGHGLSGSFESVCANDDMPLNSSFIKFDRFFKDPRQHWGRVKCALKFMGLSIEPSNVLYRQKLINDPRWNGFHPLSLVMYYMYQATPFAVEKFLSRYNAANVKALAEALCELVNHDGMSHNLNYIQRICDENTKNRLIRAYTCAVVKYAIGYKNPPHI